MAEVGPEPVVGGEPDVVRRRDDHVRDHPAPQAGHPVGEHHLRHAAEDLEAFRQQPQRRCLLLIGSEADEPEPRPGQHRAEHVHLATNDDLGAPVDRKDLTGRPDRRSTTTDRTCPRRHSPLAWATRRRKLRSDPA